MPMKRNDVAWFAAFFAAALLPRLSPLLYGGPFADDLIHLPSGHLLSYRFLNYLELGLWQFVFGADYLVGPIPKIIASLYTAALCSAIRMVLNAWAGTPRLEFSILALLIPLHPLWNTFIAWHVTGVYVLSLLLIVTGYALLASRPATGVLLIALGISGYQVHVGLLPALLFAEFSLRKTPLVRRVLLCAAAVAIYLIATQVAAFAGMQTWGGRGMGLATSLQPLTNNLAVITQPLLSFYVSVEAAWRWWPVPFVMLALLAAATRPRRWAPAPLLLPIVAASVVLLMNTGATGPRMTAAIWLALLLGAIHSRPAIAALVVVAALAIPISLTDAANRTRAWQADRRVLANLPVDFKAPADARPIVMQDFQPVTWLDHSNARNARDWFFHRYQRAKSRPSAQQ